MNYYQDWEEAAKKSKSMRAVSDVMMILGEGGGPPIGAELIKPLHGDGYWTYAGANGVVIRKARTEDVDAVKRWKSW